MGILKRYFLPVVWRPSFRCFCCFWHYVVWQCHNPVELFGPTSLSVGRRLFQHEIDRGVQPGWLRVKASSEAWSSIPLVYDYVGAPPGGYSWSVQWSEMVLPRSGQAIQCLKIKSGIECVGCLILRNLPGGFDLTKMVSSARIFLRRAEGNTVEQTGVTVSF